MAKSDQKLYRFYPYFKHKRFYNYPGEKQEGLLRAGFMLLESLLQRTRGLKKIKKDWVLNKPTFKHDENRTSSHPLITWVGHATFIIQVAGLTIVTDPIFGNPSSLFKRITRPGVSLEQLPKIDVVLLSHNHLDHMHAPSLKAIAKKNPRVKILVPLGDKAWFDSRGFKDVSEYMWWEKVFIAPDNAGEGITFTFLPAVHWSGRGLFDRNKSLWGSWMVQSSVHSIYFAGDTAYGKHFKVIAQEFPQIDTALMPIGPCEPDEDMQLTHVSPEQAGQAFVDLKAHRFIPMHWGVYWLGTCYPVRPMERMQAWWTKNQKQLASKIFNPLKFGESRLFQRVGLALYKKKAASHLQI